MHCAKYARPFVSSESTKHSSPSLQKQSSTFTSENRNIHIFYHRAWYWIFFLGTFVLSIPPKGNVICQFPTSPPSAKALFGVGVLQLWSRFITLHVAHAVICHCASCNVQTPLSRFSTFSTHTRNTQDGKHFTCDFSLAVCRGTRYAPNLSAVHRLLKTPGRVFFGLSIRRLDSWIEPIINKNSLI